MVVWRPPSANITQIKMMESLEALNEIEGMTTISEKEIKEISMIAWKNAHDMRPVTLAALANSKASRPHNTLSKMRYRNMTSAAKSLDILRQNLQAAINKEIDLVIKKYLEKFFQPAVRNIRENLGAGSVTEDLIREVCRAMLEEAKQMYCSVTLHKSTSPPADTEFQTPEQISLKKRKASADVEKENPLRNRAYPPYIKWDPSRVNKDTQFILSTTASKILGYISLKGRMGLKHPDFVKYVVDQDDREWLSTAGIPGLMQGTPNVALFLLEDIVQLANFEEYRSNALLHANELKGFVLPDFIQRKVRAYMTLMRTKYIEPEVTKPLPSPPPDPLERISPHFLDDLPLAYDELHLLDSSESTLQELSPSISEDAIFGLNCIDPCNTLQTVEENQPTIQMSVGVGVECLPSIITPLAMLETGNMVEFEPSFMAIRGGETED